MEHIFFKLRNINENTRQITKKKPFNPQIIVGITDVRRCYDFANEMVFGDGYQRAYRSGGIEIRDNYRKVADIFQGKIAEFGTYQFFLENGIITMEPDLSVMGKSIWDSSDLKIQDIKLAIKSTVYFGNLLLLEVKDWNEDGDYIPNLNTGNARYDYIILCRVKPEAKKEDEINVLKAIKTQWNVEVSGYITHNDLKNKIIKGKYIIKQGMLLNSKTRMDADNYYVQASCLRNINDLIEELKKY